MDGAVRKGASLVAGDGVRGSVVRAALLPFASLTFKIRLPSILFIDQILTVQSIFSQGKWDCVWHVSCVLYICSSVQQFCLL